MCDIFELLAWARHWHLALAFGENQVLPHKTNKFNFKYCFVIGIPGIFEILYSITFLTFPLCNNSQ